MFKNFSTNSVVVLSKSANIDDSVKRASDILPGRFSNLNFQSRKFVFVEQWIYAASDCSEKFRELFVNSNGCKWMHCNIGCEVGDGTSITNRDNQRTCNFLPRKFSDINRKLQLLVQLSLVKRRCNLKYCC